MIEPGQVWADRDPRERKRDRRIVIDRVGDDFVYARTVGTNRPTRIHRSRMVPRYWQYVGSEDPDEDDEKCECYDEPTLVATDNPITHECPYCRARALRDVDAP